MNLSTVMNVLYSDFQLFIVQGLICTVLFLFTSPSTFFNTVVQFFQLEPFGGDLFSCLSCVFNIASHVFFPGLSRSC